MVGSAYRRPIRRSFGIVGLALLLAACAQARPEIGALIATHDPAPDAAVHTIHIATTRARNEAEGTLFSGERGERTGFARIAVSVPGAHEPGKIEWPRRAPGDPAKHFVTRDGGVLADEAEFAAGLRAALAARPAGSRDVLVFVHGYNTLFAEGVYRFAQIVNDSGFTGVPVLFTWASRGRVVDYVYDRDSATAARDALERTLEVAAASGAERVHILAHSMGNWLTVETLRQARIAGNVDFGGRLGEVVLASPDIDVDVFKTQMR
ncbi:MAG: alpha/beta fold hydrolase, partial [Hyphomicrobiales bacterium]|nr:alpha/beta fold hydrolase [Hyphomicrobiales bacterium]